MAWNLNQGSPVSGVLLHEYKAPTLTNHVDLPSLLPFAAIGGQTSLGVRDVYALSHKEDVPFMIANIQGKTIENIKNPHISLYKNPSLLLLLPSVVLYCNSLLNNFLLDLLNF